MPDRLDKLRETVRELETELASLDSIDLETRSVLETALVEIRETLRRRDPESLARSHSLVTRLQDAAEGFGVISSELVRHCRSHDQRTRANGHLTRVARGPVDGAISP